MGWDALVARRFAGDRQAAIDWLVAKGLAWQDRQLAESLRSLGFEIEDSELQTTADAAVRALQGKRVLALTMHALVGDLVRPDLALDHIIAGCGVDIVWGRHGLVTAESLND